MSAPELILKACDLVRGLFLLAYRLTGEVISTRPTASLMVVLFTTLLLGLMVGRAICHHDRNQEITSLAKFPDPSWWQRIKDIIWRLVGTAAAGIFTAIAIEKDWYNSFRALVASAAQALGIR